MSYYQSLGLRKIINADATLTRLGGSLMPPEVIRAMNEAATWFVDLNELQRKVGARIAELTHNEAAYVSSGAAAGLVLATTACIIGAEAELSNRIPRLDGLKNEVIVHHTHRNGYDYAVRQVGIRLVEIGSEQGTRASDLEAAITPNTAAFVWFQGIMTTPHDLPLPQVIGIAHTHGIPVIVDAAAQLPPVSNLWQFTQQGADLVLFSGGKDLRGPQASGLVLGRKDLVEACRLHGNPYPAIGRPMKVGKEEMIGLLAAVERYLTLDHTARDQACEMTVRYWCDELNSVPGVTATRDFPNEAGQPLPRCKLDLNANLIGRTRDDVICDLMEGEPSIAVGSQGEHGIYLNPMTIEPGEDAIILQRLLVVLNRQTD
jgi:D-glucosaminate-6-phosphate ammonia-lyase